MDFSELPEEMRHKIINFLPAKEAARTTVLSKPWKSSWDSRRVLDFNDRCFRSASAFRDILEQSLQRVVRQAVSVETLCVSMTVGPPENDDLIRDWVLYALTRNLRELSLNVRSFEPYKINLLSSKRLTKLTLYGVDLTSATQQQGQWEFPRLQILSLNQTAADSDILHGLVSGSPRLEHFSLREVSALSGSLELLNLDRLKSVDVMLNEEFRRIAVKAPSLESFSCQDTDLDSVPCIHLEGCEVSLEKLSLTYMGIGSGWLNNQLSRFGGLKVLKLVYLNCLTSLKVSSTMLSELMLVNCGKLAEAEIHAPSLVKLHCVHTKYPFYSRLSVPPSLQQVVFNFMPVQENHQDSGVFYDRLKGLFNTINHVNNLVVSIMICSWGPTRRAETVIVHEGLSDSLFSVLRNLAAPGLDAEVVISSISHWNHHFFSSPYYAREIFIASAFEHNNLLEDFSEKLRVTELDPKNSPFNFFSVMYVVSYKKEVLNDWTEFEGDEITKLALLNAYSGSPQFRFTRFRLHWSDSLVYRL